MWTQSPSAPTWFTNAINFDYSFIYASYLSNGGSQVSNAPQNSFVLVGRSIYINIDGVSNVSDLKSRLSQKPLTFFVRSTNYTPAADMPVSMETHQQAVLVLDGTEGFEYRADSGLFVSASNVAPGKKTSGTVVCTNFNGETGAQPYSDNGIAINSYGQLVVKSSTYGTDASALLDAIAAQYAAGTPVTIVYQLATPITYAHDPVTLVAVPYTEADATSAQQLANTPSTLPYIDSADVPMLLDDTVQPMALAAPLASALPVTGTFVVSSQDGTTVPVSLKAMQDGGNAATIEGHTWADILAAIQAATASTANALRLLEGGEGRCC